MRTRTLLTVATGLTVCIMVVWFSRTIEGDQRTYEVHPEITIPEYRSDAAHTIDAYERLMDRYMAMTERNIVRVEGDLETIIGKLESIDRKLTELSLRISRLEKTPGTGKLNPPVIKKDEIKSLDKKQTQDAGRLDKIP